MKLPCVARAWVYNNARAGGSALTLPAALYSFAQEMIMHVREGKGEKISERESADSLYGGEKIKGAIRSVVNAMTLSHCMRFP